MKKRHRDFSKGYRGFTKRWDSVVNVKVQSAGFGHASFMPSVINMGILNKIM